MKIKKPWGLILVGLACLVLLAIVGVDMYRDAHFRSFDSIDAWYGWLDDHLDYPAEGYAGYPAYIQAEAARDRYLVSQQILFVEGDAGKELHIGLMLEIGGVYYYTEPSPDGNHATAGLGESR